MIISDTNMAPLLLFWETNMADVTSCQKDPNRKLSAITRRQAPLSFANFFPLFFGYGNIL